MQYGDEIDNDCDGEIDEEECDRKGIYVLDHLYLAATLYLQLLVEQFWPDQMSYNFVGAIWFCKDKHQWSMLGEIFGVNSSLKWLDARLDARYYNSPYTQ